MDKAILKDHIIELIGNIEDQRFLESMSAMLEAYVGKVKLSDEEKAAVEEGLKDMEEGRTMSHEKMKVFMQKRRNLKLRSADLNGS
jgi:predicted transcriptional regulator